MLFRITAQSSSSSNQKKSWKYSVYEDKEFEVTDSRKDNGWDIIKWKLEDPKDIARNLIEETNKIIKKIDPAKII